MPLAEYGNRFIPPRVGKAVVNFTERRTRGLVQCCAAGLRVREMAKMLRTKRTKSAKSSNSAASSSISSCSTVIDGGP